MAVASRPASRDPQPRRRDGFQINWTAILFLAPAANFLNEAGLGSFGISKISVSASEPTCCHKRRIGLVDLVGLLPSELHQFEAFVEFSHRMEVEATHDRVRDKAVTPS